ncbi:MAG: serine/threonine-protein kinase [Micromonosporaceae bacterium]
MPAQGSPPPATHGASGPGTASRGAAGTVIGGRYTLISPIGSGGMGAVWRANDQLLRREVAIKEVALPPGTPPSERDALTERTLREARAAAALSHPSVVRVFDVVIDSGRPWIVMELLKAHSLADLIERDGPLAARAVAKIGLALLGALEAAHQAGVLHRDVKPGNVLICADGRCVLSDFGVARSASDAELTTPGMVLGSPHFISPERATGGTFGPPSDLFSLGVTLYAAAEGQPPFDRGDAISTMHAVVNEPPEPPRRAAELIPVLYGLLEKDPAQRWDVDRTRSTLRAMLLGTPPPATGPPTAPTRMPAVRPTSPAAGTVPAPGGPDSTQARAAVPGAASLPTGSDWVGRASVPAPSAGTAHPAAHQEPLPVPASATFASYHPSGGSRRPYAAWAFGAAAVLVAMALVLGVIGYTAGWFRDGGTGTAKPTATAEAPRFKVQTYRGKGVTLNVPAAWKKRTAGNYVQFHHPKEKTAWLRINVVNDSRTSSQILRDANRNFERGCCGLSNYRRVDLRSVKLAGHRGAELEYTATSAQTKQRRHGIWRMIVVDGRNYQVYMSVPGKQFLDHKKVFLEAVRSLKLER